MFKFNSYKSNEITGTLHRIIKILNSDLFLKQKTYRNPLLRSKYLNIYLNMYLNTYTLLPSSLSLSASQPLRLFRPYKGNIKPFSILGKECSGEYFAGLFKKQIQVFIPG